MTEPGPAEVTDVAEMTDVAATDEDTLYRPADGLALLGEYQGSDGGPAEPRFLVRRADGQVVRLSHLLYRVTSAVAAGGAEGGWNADQVAMLAGAELGRGLSADNIRYLVDGKLIPLGVVVKGSASQFAALPPAAPPAPEPRLKTRPGRPRWAPDRRQGWTAVIGLAGVLAIAATVAVVVADRSSAPSAPSASSGETASPAASASARASAPPAAQAGAWIAREVSPDATVSCDPTMCRELQQAGLPAAQLKPLPATAPDLGGSDVVIATAAVRDQFGSRLAAYYAPQVIASFGSGTARVDVRAVATSGAATFEAQLAAEHAAQRSAGQQLLGNKNIRPSTSARAALKAGQVDLRLLAILSALSHQVPLAVMRFSGAPGAGPGVPLFNAEITVPTAADQSTVLAALRAQQGMYRPAAVTSATTAGGQPGVTLRFDTPAPAGVVPYATQVP
jgi:hypothetical protein